MSGSDARLSEELRRLYWESDASVAEIADTLGLSRRALYALLTPLPAGASCLECGGALIYTNRSNHAAARAECAVCGRTETVAEPVAATESIAVAGPVVVDRAAEAIKDSMVDEAGEATELEFEWRAGPMAAQEWDVTPGPRRALLLGAVALAGVAVGAAAALLVGRDRVGRPQGE